jgi:general secretion pathway protein G
MTVRDSHRSERRGEAGFSMIEVMIVLVFIGIIAGIALNGASYAFEMSRVGRTVADMRGVAEALTKYQVDSDTLPGGGLQPVSAIAATIRASGGIIPILDGWNNPIYYEPYTTAQGTATFRLYSYGMVGTADGLITGIWVDFNTDVVNESGSFVQTKW